MSDDTTTRHSDSAWRCETAAQCGRADCCEALVLGTTSRPLTARWTGGGGWVPVELWDGDRRVLPTELVVCSSRADGHTHRLAGEVERLMAGAGARAIGLEVD